jgi:hypothetical protein
MDLRVLRPNAFTSQLCDLSGAELWPFVSDPTILVGFSTELQAVRLNYEGAVALGSTFEGDQLREDRRWTTVATITALEAPRRFEWTVGSLDDPVSQWSFLVDEHQLGTTLTQKVVLCGGPSPMADFITRFPDKADEVVHERLRALRERMAISVAGVIATATKARA